MIHLPNLELLEYMAKAKIRKDSTTYNKIIAHCNSIGMVGRSANFDLVCTMFAQEWPTASTAFVKYGAPLKTVAYTTIFHEPISDAYVVFIDNRFCFTLPIPNEAFIEDFNNHQIVPLDEARKKYFDKERKKK